jgi:hypothetical protein
MQSNSAQLCLHPESSATNCSKGIIRAHTIQRSRGLERIARVGHVYQFPQHFLDIVKNNGVLRPSKVGINKATTFTGFCSKHDSSTFLPLEKEPFAPTQEKCFLLAYRAICRELYAKNAQEANLGFSRTLDKGKPLDDQVRFQQLHGEYASGVEAGADDLTKRKQEFDTILLSKDYSQVKFYVINFADTPDFLVSSGCNFQMDFLGNEIQGPDAFCDFTRLLEYTTFSIIATDKGGAAVFCWAGESPIGIQFLKSIHALPDSALPNALLRFTFEFFENVAISPSWWDGLPETVRVAIQNRVTNAANILVERKSNCLLDDSVNAVNWKVADRNTNVDI